MNVENREVNPKLIAHINELKKAINEISVYDLNTYTAIELYSRIANKLNEVIGELLRYEITVSEQVVEQNNCLQYLLNEGLTNEVINKINNMVIDGTMDLIINQNVLKDLNSQIKEKATKQELEVERQRINNFTQLAEGSTTGDAELTDGRTSYFGNTYENIGNSIRGQVKTLYNSIKINDKNLYKLKQNFENQITNYNIELKALDTTDYIWKTSKNSAKTLYPVDFRNGYILSCNDFSTYKVGMYAINTTTNLPEFSTGWITTDTKIENKNLTKDNIEKYLIIKRIDGNNLTVEEVKTLGKQLIVKKPDYNLDILQSKFELGKIKYLNRINDLTVEAGNFYQETLPYTLNTSYEMLIKVKNSNDIAMNICLRQGTGSNRDTYRTNASNLGDGFYYVKHNYVKDNDFYLFIDNRENSNDIIIDYLVLGVPVNNPKNVITNNSSIEKVLYVSPDGKDTNNGEEPTTPLKNISVALEKGATTVLCKRGNYYNPLPISFVNQFGKKLKIMPYENNNYSTNTPDRPLITLLNGDFINNLNNENGLLKATQIINNHLKDVFIDKTKEPIDTTNTRSIGYHSTVWELHNNIIKDVKLKPVLTLNECKNEAGTFFYDGSYIYINPMYSDYNRFFIPNDNNILELTGFSELVLEDLEIEFSYTSNFILRNNMNTTVRNCKSKYTMLGDGFSLDNTNGNFYNCLSFKSRNDGFNIHGYGETNFYNCIGCNNYDDGISHHDGCVGTINGGEWFNNGKGGISSPTFGAYIDIYNVECHNNKYGVYQSSSSDRRMCKGRVFNSVLYNNTEKDIIVNNGEMKLYNTKYTTISGSNNIIEL